MHAELGKVTSECETLRLMVTKFRDGATVQEKQANERVAQIEEKSALQAVEIVSLRRYVHSR
eukprot:3197158-Lingulodinium_polyedra.AAC.1